MNIRLEAFLRKGIIEDYCLGIASPSEVTKLLELCDQFPEFQKILDGAIKSFDNYFSTYKKEPPSRVRTAINQILSENLKLEKAQLGGKEQILDEYIGISKYSKVNQWENLIANFAPPEEFDNVYTKSLFKSDHKELTLLWVKSEVPDEVHINVSECFLLLEGTANCYVENQVYAMQKGDFMQIPLDVHHHVVVTSAIPAKAIMSRVEL